MKKGRPGWTALSIYLFTSRKRGDPLRPVDVFSLQTLWSALHLKLDLRALLKRPVAGHLDGRKVDKYIFAAGALDKTIAFGGVKPFHYTLFSHYLILLFNSVLAPWAPVKHPHVR